MHTDLSSEILVKPCINPAAAINANGTTTGATIDTQGYESLTFVVQSGNITDGAMACGVFGGNASNMSDEVQITSLADLIAGATTDLDFAATDDNLTKRMGVNIAKVNKRYYRIKEVQSGATTGGFFAASAILAKPRFAPQATP